MKTLALGAYPLLNGRKSLIRRLTRRWTVPQVWRGRHGILYLLDGRNYIDGRILRDGIYEGPAIEAFCAAVRDLRCDVFLDVGANIGVYSLSIAHLTPCREIVCFEPDPRNRNQLAATIFLNGLDDVITIRPEAVSDREGTARFYAQRDAANPSSVKSRLTPFDAEGETALKIEVPLVMLERAVPLTGRRIAIKMDIEGHEAAALRGMAGLTRANTVLLQVEAFPENYPEVERILVAEQGFRLLARVTTNDYLFLKE
ncbi:MAG: FkbM family methyltransferase [Rhodospirillaceae bacterium]